MQNTATKTIAVCQGELAVSGDHDVMLTAVLGSCVATCLWDRVARLGGMNHILLPGQLSDAGVGNKYGVYAMEALINELMKIGARKTNLVAKIFGGARTFENGLRIGEANARFARQFLEVESIPIIAESIGGNQARRVRFFPECGDAKQMLTIDPVPAAAMPDTTASGAKKAVLPGGGSGEVELF